METNEAHRGAREFQSTTNKSKIIAAFALVLLGSVFTLFSYGGGAMKFVVTVTAIIGFIQLAIYLRGLGRFGAIAMLLSMLLSLLSIDTASFIPDFSKMNKEISQAMFGGMYTEPESTPWDMILEMLPSILAVAGCVMWFLYKPLKPHRTAIIILGGATIMGLLLGYFDSLIANIGEGVLTLTALYMLVKGIGATKFEENEGISALIFMGVGLILSLLILTSNGYEVIACSFVGVILWLCGVSKLKGCSTESNGFGFFIAYGVLMILTLILQLIPIFFGEILASFFQIPAYIVLAVGAFKLKKNSIFGMQSGMATLGTIILLSIPLVFVFVFSEFVSAFLFSIFSLPFIILAIRNAMASQERVFLSTRDDHDDEYETEQDFSSENNYYDNNDEEDNDSIRNFFSTPIPYAIVGVLILLGGIYFYFSNQTPDNNEPQSQMYSGVMKENEELIYNGTIAGSKVRMTLHVSGEEVAGEYYYTKYKLPILLSGTVSGNEFFINEFVDGKKIGSFVLTKDVYDNLSGNWVNDTKNYKVKLIKSSESTAVNVVTESKPFKGSWSHENKGDYLEDTGMTHGDYSCSLNIDFYDKTVINIDDKKCYGILYVYRGSRGGPQDIIDVTINGNIAKIKYIDSKCDTCSGTLTYNPKDRSIEFEDGERLTNESGLPEGDFHFVSSATLKKDS